MIARWRALATKFDRSRPMAAKMVSNPPSEVIADPRNWDPGVIEIDSQRPRKSTCIKSDNEVDTSRFHPAHDVHTIVV
jgi:hypothetical protein